MHCASTRTIVERFDRLRHARLRSSPKNSALVIALVVFASSCFHTPLIAKTNVAGVISGDATWSSENSPYIVTQNVEVANRATLTIEPGVEVRFARFSLIVRGRIVARGNGDLPIRFTSNEKTPKPGDWLFLQLMPESAPAKFGEGGTFVGGCVLEHCVVEYGAGLNLVGASPWIARCTIQHNYSEEGGAIFSGGGSPMIQQNKIAYNRCNRDGGGIRTASGHAKILENEIVYNTARGRGGGIATNYSPITIRGNTVAHNWAHTGGGIATGAPRLGETSMTGKSHSKPLIEDNVITHNMARAIGGGISVRGTPKIVGNQVSFNRIAYTGAARRNHRASRMDSTDRRKFTGAGIYVEGTYGGPAEITRNTIIGNQGAKWGGGVFTDRASLVFTDNYVARNQSVEFGGGLSIVNRRSSRSFVSDGHGPSIVVSGTVFRENDGGDIEVSGVGGQSIAIRRCNLYSADGLSVLNHCITPIDAKEVWWGSDTASTDSRIYDGSDDQSLGRVIHSGQSSPYPLEHAPKTSDATLVRMTTRPTEFRSAQGIFQVQGAPPSISAVWKGIDGDGVAGYRLHIAEVIPTYHERIVVETDKGYSPIDCGLALAAKIGGLKPKTQYEVSVWAYDAEGTEALSTEPLLVATKAE